MSVRREYFMFFKDFWTGPTGRELRKAGGDAQRLAIYLFTCPSANRIGLYYLALPTAAHELGMSEGELLAALVLVEATGFARYDSAAEVVFVPTMARHQVLDGREALKPDDARAVGVRKTYENAPKSAFLGEFFGLYGSAFGLTRRDSEVIGPGQATTTPAQGHHEAPSRPPQGPPEGARPQVQVHLQGQLQGQVQEQVQSQESAPAPAVAEAAPAHPVLDAIESTGIEAWQRDRHLTYAWAQAQQAAFPGLDLVAEVRKCASWWLSNPGRVRGRKEGAPTLRGWFRRESRPQEGPKRRGGASDAQLVAAGQRTKTIFADMLNARKVGG